MSAYKAYGTTKTTPARKSRKTERRTIFQFNRSVAKIARKERRLARREAENVEPGI